MGLDMYLHAKQVFFGDFGDDDQRAKAQQLQELTGIKAVQHTPIIEVSTCVAYWRKANAIHDWFVRNVQDGEDDCQPHHVEREQLATLHKEATLALRLYEAGDHNGAKNLLTPTAGFFFGSTDVDEHYAYDLRRTVEQLDAALALRNDPGIFGPGFYYQSSW